MSTRLSNRLLHRLIPVVVVASLLVLALPLQSVTAAETTQEKTPSVTVSAYTRWDINQDGKVDYRDLAILGAHYGELTSEPYPNWDTNQDGVIDYKDLAVLGAHYGESYPINPVNPMALWWAETWSEDGREFEAKYTWGVGSGSYTGNSTMTFDFDPAGVILKRTTVEHLVGEDDYGRGIDLTTTEVHVRREGSLKWDSLSATGTSDYQTTAGGAQVLFTRTFTSATTNLEFYVGGLVKSGRVDEEFSGRISSSTGEIAYSGNASSPFTFVDGDIAYGERTETTSFYNNGEPYADMVMVIRPESQLINNAWRLVSDNITTETVYADGSQRGSETLTLYTRDSYGRLSSKSESGTVTGTEIIRGETTAYQGSIVVTYILASDGACDKRYYNETRSAQTALPKRLPLEVIFAHDWVMRLLY